MPDTLMAAVRVPTRDFCPALRNIRLRMVKRLALIEEELAAAAQPVALLGARAPRLAKEREEIVAALRRLVVASERGLAPDARVRELEALLDLLPACVTHRARARVRLLIEGLDSAA